MSILKRLKRQEGIRNLYMDITEGDFPPQRGDYFRRSRGRKRQATITFSSHARSIDVILLLLAAMCSPRGR